jgi:hypothetical protein
MFDAEMFITRSIALVLATGRTNCGVLPVVIVPSARRDG